MPDSELTRQFDSVPRSAKSQEFTANRIIYGNYLSKYDQSTKELGKIVVTAGNTVKQRDVGLLGVFQGFSQDELQGATREQKQIEAPNLEGE